VPKKKKGKKVSDRTKNGKIKDKSGCGIVDKYYPLLESNVSFQLTVY